MPAPLDHSTYANETTSGVPGVAHDETTFRGWHLNVMFSGDVENDPPFHYLVFDPSRTPYAGDIRRQEDLLKYVLVDHDTSERLVDNDVKSRLLELVQEFEVILETLGKGLT